MKKIDLCVEAVFLAELCKKCNNSEFLETMYQISLIYRRVAILLDHYGILVDITIKGDTFSTMQFEKVILIYNGTEVYCNVDTLDISIR